MASYPYARVAHLTGLESPGKGYYGHKSTTTPTTLTGGFKPPRYGYDWSLYSYQLCIAWSKDGEVRIHPDNNSPTTNRHIRATAYVVGHNGYQECGTDDNGWTIYRKKGA